MQYNLQALSEFLLLACHPQSASRGNVLLDSLCWNCFGYLPLDLGHQTHDLQVLQELFVLGNFFKFCPLIGILVEQLAKHMRHFFFPGSLPSLRIHKT